MFTIASFWCNSLKTQLLGAGSFMPLFSSTSKHKLVFFWEQKNFELTNKIDSLWIQDWVVGNFSEWFETWKLLKNVSRAGALGFFVTLFRTRLVLVCFGGHGYLTKKCESSLAIANVPFYNYFSWFDYLDSIYSIKVQYSKIVHRRRIVARLLGLLIITEHNGIKVWILSFKKTKKTKKWLKLRQLLPKKWVNGSITVVY